MVRNRLIRKLDLEVMDLTPTGFYDWLPPMLGPATFEPGNRESRDFKFAHITVKKPKTTIV
jgi:hypothetical protein